MNEIYCGPPPTPSSLLTAWNFDLIAISLCILLLSSGVLLSECRRGYLFYSVSILGILFISPICALTAALFSARVIHHVVLVVVVAPLLAAAFPRFTRISIPLSMLVVIHAAAIWIWHAPAIYVPAISSTPLYWLMQATLLGTGFILWRCIFDGNSRLAGFLAIFATATQMGLLGALLTFIREPLYPPHFASTGAFGLTPLADQQLAGLIMWVPAALPYLAIALMLLFSDDQQREASMERGPG